MVEALKEQLASQLRTSLRERDKLSCSVIRSIIAAAKNAEIAQQKVIDDSGVIAVISKLAKQHRESIDAFKQGGRQDLVEQEEAELAILNKYLPQQMSRAEIEDFAKKVISEVKVVNFHDKGKVMARLMPQLKGKADGALINAVVTELLNQ